MQSPLYEGVDVKAADCMGPHYLFVLHALFLLDSFDPRLLKNIARSTAASPEGLKAAITSAMLQLSHFLPVC